MYELQELKNRLYNRIHDTRDLLGGLEKPVRSPLQGITNEEHIGRLNEIILNANMDLLDIEADHKNSIEAAELEAFIIQHRTRDVYNLQQPMYMESKNRPTGNHSSSQTEGRNTASKDRLRRHPSRS